MACPAEDCVVSAVGTINSAPPVPRWKGTAAGGELAIGITRSATGYANSTVVPCCFRRLVINKTSSLVM